MTTGQTSPKPTEPGRSIRATSEKQYQLSLAEYLRSSWLLCLLAVSNLNVEVLEALKR
jgi:hypothetical protein